MSRLEPADKIEGIVGTKRHDSLHLARAVSAEERVYVLHSAACVAVHEADGADLRECLYSLALDEGIDLDVWEQWQDRPVAVDIDEEYGELVPSTHQPALAEGPEHTDGSTK